MSTTPVCQALLCYIYNSARVLPSYIHKDGVLSVKGLEGLLEHNKSNALIKCVINSTMKSKTVVTLFNFCCRL